MASYHFRIKSDKKSNGERVSASVHVDYISRLGKYQNEGADKNQETNCISFANQNFPDESFPLYLSDNFGKIFSTPQGLQINGKYSPTTLSVALTLAKNMSDNQPLILTGSKKFKNKILEIAVENELDITFADENLQNKFQKLLEMKKNDERKFKDNGGTIFYSRPIAKSNFKKFDGRTISDVANAGFNLQVLSAKSVANAISASATDVLLSPDELSQLVETGKQNYSRLRWNLSSEQRNYAELTANKILQNLDELKIQVSATSHFEYINREKKIATRGDCIFTQHHLPTWAHDNPKTFFQAADQYEGKNNSRYVEIEFSLPNELTDVADYKKIIDKFLNAHLQNHYYAYAIHEKSGAFSGIRHPHVHIMFSERLIDDVEKIQDRSPENFFKSAARKKRDGSQPTFEEKAKRGSPKDRKWHDRHHIFQLREDFAKIQNEVLAEKGFDVRVDHRSLKSQRDDALQRGDKFLAQLLDRVPEKYLSPLPLDDQNPKVQELKKNRANIFARNNKFIAADFFSHQAEEKNLAKYISAVTGDLQNLRQRDDFNFQPSKKVTELKSEVEKLTKEITALRRLLISSADALQQAKLQYMSKADKKIFLQFHDAKFQRDNLQKFFAEFSKMPADFKSTSDYYKIESAAQNKIRSLDSYLLAFKKFVDQIELKLRLPETKNNINFATHNILQQNVFVREKLKTALDKLQQLNKKLHDEFPIASPEQKIFYRDDFINLLQRPCMRLIDTKDTLRYQQRKLINKLISLPRARLMAENIFVRAELKKLQTKKVVANLSPDNFFYDKDNRTYPIAKLNYKISNKIFEKLKTRAKQLNGTFAPSIGKFVFRTNFDRNKFIEEFAPTKIRDFKTLRDDFRHFEKIKNKLSTYDFMHQEKALDDELDNLKKICASPDAQKKILDIAIGILRKNQAVSDKIKSLDEQIKTLDTQIQRLKKQMISASSNLPRNFKPQTIMYQNKPIQATPLSVFSILAKTLSQGTGDAKAIGQSDNISDKSFDMDKNWNTLSEIKKHQIKSSFRGMI